MLFGAIVLGHLYCYGAFAHVWFEAGVSETDIVPQPEVWHKGDYLHRCLLSDSIVYTDSYTIYAVVRNPEPDSIQWLWCFADNDTLTEAVHTRGIYTRSCGMQFSTAPHDFSRWSIYRYYSGCHSDSTRSRSLALCSPSLFILDSTANTDTVHSSVQMMEMAYLPGAVSQKASDMFQTYLALKYGITLDGAPYLSYAGDTLWHPDNDRIYYHRIVGVGNDTIRQWYASSSVSFDSATFTLQADTLRPGEYILMGDNGDALNILHQADGTYRMEREWLLRPYLKQPASLRLTIPYSALPEDAQDSVWLMASDTDALPLYTIQPSRGTTDSICQFVLPPVCQVPLILSLWGNGHSPKHRQQQQHGYDTSQGNAVYYNMSDGTIEVNGIPNGQIVTAMLYDSTGKLLGGISAQLPILVSSLPGNACHIELLSGGTIIGSATLPFKR